MSRKCSVVIAYMCEVQPESLGLSQKSLENGHSDCCCSTLCSMTLGFWHKLQAAPAIQIIKMVSNRCWEPWSHADAMEDLILAKSLALAQSEQSKLGKGRGCWTIKQSEMKNKKIMLVFLPSLLTNWAKSVMFSCRKTIGKTRSVTSVDVNSR